MSTTEQIFIIIGIALVALAIWQILPKAMLSFVPGAIKSRFEPGRYLTPADLDYAEEVIDSLKALGYRMVGTLVEKPPLWRRPFETLILTSDSPADFLCVNVSKRRISYYFETVFSGEEIVITADGGFRPVDQDGLYQYVIAAEDPAEVLAGHRENVSKLVSEGLTPVPAHNPDVIAGAFGLYYGFPAVKKGLRRFGFNNLILFAILCIPLIITLT